MELSKIINSIYRLIVIILLILFINLLLFTYIGFINSKFSFMLNKDNLKAINDFYKNDVLAINKKIEEKIKISFTQEKTFTCGPAAVRYLFYYFGIIVTEKELEELMNTTQEGSSLYTMKKVVEKYGLNSKGLLVNYLRLKEIRMPVIAFVKNNHFTVIKKITNRYVYLFDPDPEYGYIRISKETFLKVWNGVILKVNTKPIIIGS